MLSQKFKNFKISLQKFKDFLKPLKVFFGKGEKIAIIDAKFLWLVLMNGLTYALLYVDDFVAFLFKAFVWNFGLFFCVLYPCAIFKQSLCKVILNALFWVSFAVCVINLFLFINFNTFLDPVALQIFFATNTREASEFIGFYTGTSSIVVILIFLAFTLLAFLSKFSLKVPKRLCLLIILISIVPLSSNVIRASYNKTADKTLLLHFTRVFSKGYSEQMNFIKEYRNLSQRLDLMLAKKLTRERERERDENLTQEKSYISQSKQIPKIILIIGESTQRNYMQIYGYDLPTTPNLNELVRAENLFIFDDVISPKTSTSATLQLVLTFSNYENSHILPWYEQMNLIDAMKLLGYETFWLSNQEQISIYGNVAEAIAKRANLSRFSTTLSSLDTRKDEILLKMFDELMLAGSKQFIVFYLMGTHSSYKRRYPSEFAKFNREILRQKGLDEFYGSQKPLNSKQLQTRAEYANAVLYNDFVVSEIMQKFKDDEAIVFYLSDHGDEVYDTRNFAGHGAANRYTLEIPFMIYLSDKFKAAHPQILACIEAAQQKPFMSDNFIHALFDLLGIECVELDKSLSLFNGDFNATRPRIIGGKDYDKVLK